MQHETRWEKQHIDKAHGIVSQVKSSKSYLNSLNKTYIIVLIIFVLINFVLITFLLPFILFLDTISLHVLLGLIALSFGLFFESLIRTLEAHEVHIFRVLNIIVPLLALLSFLNTPQAGHNTLLLGINYTLFFSIPLFIVYHRK